MGDCGVCLTGYDSDYSSGDFCNVVVRKARKPHVCSECKKQILPGEKYEHAAGKSDGDMWFFDTCLVCAEIADAFYCEDRYFGGLLWEGMSDVYHAMTTGCFERLTTAAAKA